MTDPTPQDQGPRYVTNHPEWQNYLNFMACGCDSICDHCERFLPTPLPEVDNAR